MITEDRLSTFINSFDTGLSAPLEELAGYAKETQVPIIRPQMMNLMKVLLKLKKPMRVLEVGTAIGFSALLMCEYAPEGCHITTIENYEKRIPIAKENFRRFGREDSITLLEGDAADILKELEEPFDFIFLDAAKGQYINYLPELIRLLEKDAILLSDNILQEGDILESRFAVRRRDRTIHSRMREYLYALKHSPELISDIWPIGDGVTISIKTS